MVAPALERCTCRRADGGGVEVVVAQSCVGNLVEGRGRDRSAERAGPGETEVVDQNDQHIGGTLRRFHLEARRRCRITHVELGIQGRIRLRKRKHSPIEPTLGFDGSERFFGGRLFRRVGLLAPKR